MPYFFYLTYRNPDGTLNTCSGKASDLNAVILDLEKRRCVIVDIDYES